MDPIRYVDMETGQVCEERVYGGALIRLLYGTPIGRLFAWLIAWPPLSRLYGWLQNQPFSVRKVQPFIEEFDIRVSDFLPDDNGTPSAPYATFNQFFTRRLAPGARSIAAPPAFPAPCDARYYAYASLDDTVSVPVKGGLFKASALLNSDKWIPCFENGPGFVARLCPVDYHRFHFPDDGEVLDSWRISGALHSVNPWALAHRGDIFMINERQVTILDTRHFGRIAYVEVGATCVGKIQQTYKGSKFSRGDEKGMFLFGGSTVIVLGERERWRPADSLLENTDNGIETYLRLGQVMGSETPVTR